MSVQLKADILAAARELGFEPVGCSEPVIGPTYQAAYRQWLALGFAGTMTYLGRHLDKRLDPCVLVPEARTVLCVGLNYFQTSSAANIGGGRIARYAWGQDYHRVVKDRLGCLAARIHAIVGRDVTRRSFVDSGPVLERVLAAQAGLGWIGKNGLLIHPRRGSYFFLGELFLDIELPPDEPSPNRCGDCRRCLDACPTGACSAGACPPEALVRPGVIDARRCIAYLTIEHRGQIDETLADKMGDRLFGCDACQEVCPFNRQATETAVAEFRRPILGPRIDPRDVLAWDEPAYQARTTGSAGVRLTLAQWHRNARIAVRIAEIANDGKPSEERGTP